ncbi:MAG TPA: hypothetical protein VFT75_18690 [Nocardioidaceae bacterium]|jgi:hypothetical protein|nr:hypothetical protein [Nocardioidaceae bacterium]
MAQEASASKATNSFPQQRTEKPELAGGPFPAGEPGGPVRPLPFDRLLSVAVLTPGQATLVAVQLLDAVDRSGTYAGGVRLGAVALAPSGDIRVAPAPPHGGTLVSELLGQLLQNARRLPAHPRPEQLQLLRRLETAVDGDPSREPDELARELEEALTETLGPGYRQRLSDQLAALVHAFAHVAPSVPAAVGGGPSPVLVGTLVANHRASRPVSRRAAPARTGANRSPDRSRALMHRRRRGGRVALVVLILAAVVAGGGYLLVRGQGLGFVGSLVGGSQPAAPATTAPAHTPKQQAKHQRQQRHHSRAVPAVAGRHAGPVTAVMVRKTGSCKPGAQCPVKVTVHLRPSSTTRAIGWKVGAARLCRRGMHWSPATTVTAQPGWTTVFAHSSVRVPKGRSLALVALTTTPARAQSRPVPVTGPSLHC